MSSTGTAKTRVALKNFHDWLLPERAVVGILSLGLVFVFVGVVLLLIGGALKGWGAGFLGIGMCLVLICLLLCLHSCFVLQIADQETQTDVHTLNFVEGKRDSDFIPTYAVIDKKPPPSPSSLKNHRVNGGMFPKKHVTMAPDVQEQPTHDRTVIPIQYQTTRSPPPYGAQNQTFPSGGGQQDFQRQNMSFPMYSTQPTPYSTLSGRQQTYPMQVYPVHRPAFDDDYDNAEHSPMITQYQSKSMQQQQQQSQWRTGSFPSRDEDLPEPQPLQYPSAKRPMTFEQTSSSKMSIYDNVQFGLDKLDEE